MTPGDPVRELVLDSLLEQVPLVVFAYDRAGLCTYCDGAGLSAVALRPAELVGANLLELSDHLPGQADHLRGALDGKSASYTWRRGEASFDTWLTPLTDASGEVVGAIGITLDVSEKARDKDDLDLHRAFVDASPQFVALARIDGKVTYVNPGGRRMAGIPTDVDVTTTTIPDYLTEEGLQLSLEVEQPEVIAKGYYDGETTLKHWPSGRGIPVRVSSFLVRDALTGEPRALATVQTDITAEKVARLEADRRISQQRALLLHLHEAQEVERRRIAGEMHDDTIQAVAAVNIRLQSLRRTLSAAGLVAESESVAQMSESVRDATERLRGLLYTIDSPDVLERDLVTALRDYVRETGSPEGPAVDVVTLLVDTLPAHVSRVLFRIAQEAVGNARAHAAARTVTVTAGQRDGGFILSVRDDGVGLPEHLATSARGRAPAAAGHIGLRTMAERAESVGGWCSVRGLAEGGTLVEVWLPARIGYTSAASGETVPGGLSHALLQQTMESISEGFAALDREWHYIYVNQVGADMIRRHDLPGKVCWDEFEFSPETEDAYRTAMRDQRPTTARVLYADLGRWVESRVYPSADGISVFFRDVTQEQLLERRAAARERVLTRATELAGLLAAEPDLDRAMAQAAALIRETYRLSVVRLSVEGAAPVSLGDPVAGEPDRTIPVALFGRTLGELTVGGVALPDEKLTGVAAGIALRAGGRREPMSPVDRSESHA